MANLFIGLMSGTSVDSLDAIVVDFSSHKPNILATYSETIPLTLKTEIFELTSPGENEIHRLGQLDRQIGLLFANAVKQLLANASLKPSDIQAIGSHGQTIRHTPQGNPAYTLQIGDPHTIAHETNITTIADFRRRDIAAGGEGAPLVPGFHHDIFYDKNESRIILNIGGIANITMLPNRENNTIVGFDTGPGNTLIDQWIQTHANLPYDKNGQLAAQGEVIESLLNQLLSDPYFQMTAPKSTGPDYFNLRWLKPKMAGTNHNLNDVLATLTELSAQSIAMAIKDYSAKHIFVCGGGAHNLTLMQKIRHALSHHTVESTEKLGIDPDWVEATAFAWLAKQTLQRKPGNIPSVTGASASCVLGSICYP